MLPAWCCEAVGGQSEFTDIVSAAWKLFHIAAHTLDNVADRDPPLNWWVDYGPGVAINTSTALIIAANSILNTQFEQPDRYPRAREIISEFNRSLEIICSGQHLDLIHHQPGTGRWWEVAEAKSGEPFSLACKVGAMVGTENSEIIEAFAKFGHHLGIIVQIQDDLHDFVHEDLSSMTIRSGAMGKSLPIAYALEVLPENETNHLEELLDSINEDEFAKEQAINIVEKTGAVVFIETKKDQYKNKALAAIDFAAVDNSAKRLLLELVDYLTDL